METALLASPTGKQTRPRHIPTLPSSWTLDAYPRDFPATLGILYPDDPEIAELAWLDLALGEAFVAADAVALGTDDLAGIDWDRAILHVTPTIDLGALTTNATAIWSALAGDDTPPAVEFLPEPGAILVWRDGQVSRFRAIDQYERQALLSVRAGLPFAELCVAMVDAFGEDQGIARAGQLLGQWLADGMIVGIEEQAGMKMKDGAMALLALVAPAFASQPALAGDANHPAVLELYQSQGCSSCPPADAVLNTLADRRDLLALSFAVTYWDQLGWKDMFASPAFTRRQWDDARAAGRSNVATPQLIVNGLGAVNGGDRADVDAAIRRFARPADALAITGNPELVTIAAGKGRAVVWLVRYDPRPIAVPIRAGENGGRTIVHRNIVRQLIRLSDLDGLSASYRLPASPPGLVSAILAQRSVGGPIIAARRL